MSGKEQRPTKRRKIRLACQECRDKKTRCDGNRPVCNACVRKKLGSDCCIYLDGSTDDNSLYVRSLETRIVELERTSQPSRWTPQLSSTGDNVRVLGDGFRAGIGVNHSETPNAVQQKSHDSHTQPYAEVQAPKFPSDDHQITAFRLMDLHNQNRLQRRGPGDSSHDGFESSLIASRMEQEIQRSTPSIDEISTRSLRENIDSQNRYSARMAHEASMLSSNDLTDVDTRSSDVMGASEGPLDESGRTVFLGHSSAAGFMREVQESAGQINYPPGAAEHGASSIVSRKTPKRTKGGKDELMLLLENLILPPRRVADVYLEQYWERVHPLFPVLVKPTFMAR
jgi:hypothetical protein